MLGGIKVIIALVAVLVGLSAILKLVSEFEIAIGLISLTFGVLAIIWVYRAKNSLSEGSSLKEYAALFMYCLILIIAYSSWEILEKLFSLTGYFAYPKYFLISWAYLMFVFTAYKMLRLSKEFGFGEKGKKIEAIIKSKAAKKK